VFKKYFLIIYRQGILNPDIDSIWGFFITIWDSLYDTGQQLDGTRLFKDPRGPFWKGTINYWL